MIQPEVFREEEEIQAWFTLKNESRFENNGSIHGLNLGLNTSEREEVVQEKRNSLFQALKLDPEWVALADQVHGDRIQVVTKGGAYTETDGFVTQVPHLALGIQVADCAAVLLADVRSRTIAAVHAGWRGAVAGIIPKAVKYMVAQRADEKNIRAFVGPCISQKHFEVGTEVAEQFPEQFVDHSNYEKPHVDLKGYIQYQLMTKGIKPDHIEVHEGCTVGEDKKFYSYRREGEKSGRMMGIIQLLNRDE